MISRSLLGLAFAVALNAQTGRLQTSDLYKLRSVGAVALSPDASMVAYAVSTNAAAGKPSSQVEILTLATNAIRKLAGASSSNPLWSPDGRRIAYNGEAGGKKGLVIANADGTGARFISKMEGTNHPLTFTAATFTWSPDSKQIAFLDAQPGPETADASGDPIVITRYLYKPDAAEGNTRFNDNLRLHIFVANADTGAIRQLTTGNFYEHSIDWSPKNDEIAFVSNREEDSDQFHNYDLWTVRATDGRITRLTATENAEYNPRWSPDGSRIAYIGTRRGLTDLETTMEDTHVWVMNADGSQRTEIGKALDNRQGPPQWSPDGEFLHFTAHNRGQVHLYRMPSRGNTVARIVEDRGNVGAFSLAGSRLAYAFTSTSDQAELYIDRKPITQVNSEALANKEIAKVEAFTFESNDFKFQVEAFLTHPLGRTATSKHPLIVVIHGGPHGQQGPAFNLKNQVYAARGWATLMVNYRGSTGYGQKFTDAVFGDQNGNEAQDVLYAVSAAIRRNPWIDRNRMGVEGGSYGGQLSAWLVTQTHIFKAAIPLAPIINLVSYNYMTYYNMYEQMTFGVFPHQGDLMDTLWKRSSLRYVAQVKTPVMLLHGENDNDVPIAESEQFYIALKDVGVESVMVRYPREGHGLRETKHIVDSIDRSIQWYVKHFPK